MHIWEKEYIIIIIILSTILFLRIFYLIFKYLHRILNKKFNNKEILKIENEEKIKEENNIFLNEKDIKENTKNAFLYILKIFFIIFFIIFLLFFRNEIYKLFFESEECKKIKREIEYMNDYFWKELTEKNFIAQEMKNYYCK